MWKVEMVCYVCFGKDWVSLRRSVGDFVGLEGRDWGMDSDMGWNNLDSTDSVSGNQGERPGVVVVVENALGFEGCTQEMTAPEWASLG